MVIPVSTIEKYFPAPRLPWMEPDIPCYDLKELKDWAEVKGCEIKFATTPSKNGKRMLPAIRFIPLAKIDPLPNPAPYPTTNNTDTKHDWHNKPLGKTAIGVSIVVLGAITLWVLNHYLNLGI